MTLNIELITEKMLLECGIRTSNMTDPEFRILELPLLRAGGGLMRAVPTGVDM